MLKFAIGIKKEFPGSAESDDKVGKDTEKANQVFNMVFNGPANVVGNANGSTIALSVAPANFASLESALVRTGVQSDDIERLRKAIAAEPNVDDGRFGPKVAAWIGRMVEKAGAGTWAAGTGAAGTLLAEAISRYYGLK